MATRYSKMDPHEAKRRAELAEHIAMDFGFPLGEDFHTLRSITVDAICDAATQYRYRKPKNANGSTARYFYAKLNRDASRNYLGKV